jgi:hypothetical protein
MDSLQTLTDLMNALNIPVNKRAELVTSVIDANFQLYKNRCNICDKHLSQIEIANTEPHDFLVVCTKHREYAKHFQSDPIRKQLRIKPRRSLQEYVTNSY